MQLFVNERGNSGDKIYYQGSTFYVPAAVSEDREAMVNGALLPAKHSRKPLDNLRVVVNGVAYQVGGLAMNSLSWRSPIGMGRYSHGDYAQVLTHGAFAASGASGEIAVVTGLPIDDWAAPENRRTITQHFMGTHNVAVPQKRGGDKTATVVVKRVEVMPETLGTYYNLLLNEDGSHNKRFLGRIGIIDAGRYTTCLVVIDSGKFDDSFSLSTPHGMQEILNTFRTLVYQKTGYRIQPEKIQGIFDSGILPRKGDQVDVSAQRDQAINLTVDNLLNEAAITWRDAQSFDYIGITGGVAPLFHPRIKSAYNDAELVEDSLLANCLGMAKWGQLKICR